MNRIVFLGFTCLLLGSWLYSQSGDYTQFEKENMESYRVAYDFAYPEFPAKDSSITQPVVTWTPTDPEDETPKGTVAYKMDPGINRLIALHREMIGLESMMDGYRVQLFAGSNLGTANKIKSDFTLEYDDEEAYLDWEQPTFRVRVGDFLTKNEAIVFCNELKSKFPGAFVVKDRVKKPELRRRFDPMITPGDSLDQKSPLPRKDEY